MNTEKSRRAAIKKMGVSASLLALQPSLIHAMNEEVTEFKPKGNIKHSVCKWCYSKISLEELASKAKKLGLSSIEIVGPDSWPTLKKYGLDNAMPNGGEISLTKGFNHTEYHAELFKRYSEIIPKVAAAGYDKIICFSGNREGLSDEQGLANAAAGLKPLMSIAEKYKVTMVMELLNSKVNHKDYQCDHTAWGVQLCNMVGSDRFKLLYDIYHMQIMEGDVIATIKANHQYIAHYHTGGVPGRNEIDQTQELYYPAIMKAILETGYKGYVGQEFIPKQADVLASLAAGVKICDV